MFVFETLHSPAADRNKLPIAEILEPLLPSRGSVLEVASGTGQHAAFFASRWPTLTWQPTDPMERHRESIHAFASQVEAPGLLPPLCLDVEASDQWPQKEGGWDAIYCANMIHIAPFSCCEALLKEAGNVLRAGGALFLYGPFFQKEVLAAPSNLAFDERLKQQHESWGIRNLETVSEIASTHGLTRKHVFTMPANNLLVHFQKNA